MTNRTAAARYARALLDVAVQESVDLDRIEQELTAFTDLIRRHATLENALLNPVVAASRKKAAVTEISRQAAQLPIVAKLLALLAGRDRLIVVSDLVNAYRDRLLEYRKIVRAEVTTAAPLPEGRSKTIEASLAKATGRSVVLETKVDPRILGGMIAKVGSTVYDGSVTRRLEKIKEQLQQH